jgi:hypothetical protein
MLMQHQIILIGTYEDLLPSANLVIVAWIKQHTNVVETAPLMKKKEQWYSPGFNIV